MARKKVGNKKRRIKEWHVLLIFIRAGRIDCIDKASRERETRKSGFTVRSGKLGVRLDNIYQQRLENFSQASLGRAQARATNLLVVLAVDVVDDGVEQRNNV